MGYANTYTFTRGQNWASANLTNQFNDIRTAFNAALTGSNFAANAGIPEVIFNFANHTHADGSLADDSVGEEQVDHSTAKRVQWVRTPFTTGVKIITGRVIGMILTQGGQEGYIQFGQGSAAQSDQFLVGTSPKVFLTLVYSGSDFTSSFYYRVYPIEITSVGFKYHYETDDTTNNTKLWYIDYLAIGTAPGFITSPFGVKL